ncbi:MAG: hypothetical protein J6I69_02245 [Bacilli bacterium]|nr:hypothetical protein [Bacilli bacterium]
MEKPPITRKIKQLYREYYLRQAYARGQIAIYRALIDERQNAGTKKSLSQIAELQSRIAIIETNLQKLNDAFESTVNYSLNKALNGYSEMYKKIWFSYMILDNTSQYIASKVNLSYQRVWKIVVDMNKEIFGTTTEEERKEDE